MQKWRAWERRSHSLSPLPIPVTIKSQAPALLTLWNYQKVIYIFVNFVSTSVSAMEFVPLMEWDGENFFFEGGGERSVGDGDERLR